MKKTAQLVLLYFGGLLAVFFVALPVHAYTIVSNPSLPFQDMFYTDNGASTTASGRPGTFIGYFESVGASHSTDFSIELYTRSGGSTTFCASSTLQSIADLAIPTVVSPGDPTIAVYRAIPLEMSCTVGAGSSLEFLINSNFNDVRISGSNTAPGTPATFRGWWLVTTDTATSSIYTYQDSSLGISTSTAAIYCDASFSGSGLSAEIGNAMCNVVGFLFVPDQTSLNSFASLQSTFTTKIPFSYAYELQTIFLGLSASTTANLPILTLNFPNPASTTPLGNIVPTSVVGLSTSTIAMFLPDEVRLSLLSLQRVALWVGFVFLIYRRIIPHHVIEKTT